LSIALPGCKRRSRVIAATKTPIHPALLGLREERARSVQNRVADSITGFAGSMWFVYLHIAWFSIWIALGVEYYQYGLLTILDLTKTIYKLTLAHELALGGPPAASK